MAASSIAHVVGPDEAGTRLDLLLVRLAPGCSRRQLMAAIRDGHIRVRGKTARPGLRVEAGDEIAGELPVAASEARAAPDPSVRFDVLYEDADVLIVDKPAGIPTHALRAGETGTLLSGVLVRFPEVAAAGPGLDGGLVHRLDTGTSGAVVLARSANAYAALRAAFRRGEAKKTYVALVVGAVPRATLLSWPIGRHPADAARRVAVTGPDVRYRPPLHDAETEVRPKAASPDGGASAVLALPRTGRTHQIRVHLAAAGHPCAGDPLYGRADDGSGLSRQALHALEVELSHPRTTAPLRVRAPLSGDLLAAASRLGIPLRSDTLL